MLSGLQRKTSYESLANNNKKSVNDIFLFFYWIVNFPIRTGYSLCWRWARDDFPGIFQSGRTINNNHNIAYLLQ